MDDNDDDRLTRSDDRTRRSRAQRVAVGVAVMAMLLLGALTVFAGRLAATAESNETWTRLVKRMVREDAVYRIESALEAVATGEVPASEDLCFSACFLGEERRFSSVSTTYVRWPDSVSERQARAREVRSLLSAQVAGAPDDIQRIASTIVTWQAEWDFRNRAESWTRVRWVASLATVMAVVAVVGVLENTRRTRRVPGSAEET